MKTYAIVLAAGKGTRMNSDLPKVMHKISGIPMLEHIINKLENIFVDEIYLVTGHKSNVIKDYFKNNSKIKFIDQEEQLGTAHAVMNCATELFQKQGKTLILTGDTPLISEFTLSNLIQNSGLSDGTVLTTIENEPFGYGRILRDENKNVSSIIEEKDANYEQKQIKEVNSGIFCFDNEKLFSLIGDIKNDNSQNEYYLTDIVQLFNENGLKFTTLNISDNNEVMGINDRFQLLKAEEYNQRNIIKKHALNGVTFLNPSSCYIENDVIIGKDTIIESNVTIKGNTIIGDKVNISSNSTIIDSKIDDFSIIVNSFIQNSEIGKNVKIGPFANIRPETTILDNSKIGNFVEIKKSTIRENTKISHLSYIGDADVGMDVNIGCGTITVNYDGENKYKTIIKDKAFIGCNSNLIAPITIGENAVVAAGSTITYNVPDNALGIARERQFTKENYRK